MQNIEPNIEKLPEGVVFVAKRNMKDRFFLASKKNYFGGWCVHNVLVVVLPTSCHFLRVNWKDLLIVFLLKTICGKSDEARELRQVH